jgi:hypothetical protein
MANAVSTLLKYKTSVAIPPVIAAALYVYFLKTFASRKRAYSATDLSSIAHKDGKRGSSKQRVGVNRRFFDEMSRILPIIVPGRRFTADTAR